MMADTADIIYLYGYCGNRTIYDAFWDPNLSWNSTNPDLSRCLQHTAISPGICAILWVLFLCYQPWLRDRPIVNSLKGISKISLARLILSVALALLAAIEVVYYTVFVVQEGPDAPMPSIYISALLRLFTYILVTVFVILAYKTGKHSSGILFLFFLFQVIFGIIQFRSQILQHERGEIEGYLMFAFVCFFVEFGLVLLSFIVNTIPDLGAFHDSKVTKDDGAKICPEVLATAFSRFTFWWFSRTVLTGYRQSLAFSDVWRIRDEDSCQQLVPNFQDAWESQLVECDMKKRKLYTEGEYRKLADDLKPQNGHVNLYSGSVESQVGFGSTNPLYTDNGEFKGKDKDPSLLWAMIKVFGPVYLLPGFLFLIYDLLILTNPIVLSALITFIEEYDPFVWRGYVYAFSMFFCCMISVLCMNQNLNYMYTAGMRARAALCAVIYRKSLRLSCTARRDASAGEIVTLMSVDTQKIQDAAQYLHYLWGVPLAVVLATALLWQVLGPSALAGIAFLLLILPVNSVYFAKKIRSFQRMQMKHKDSRVKLVNQVLNGMKVLKLYAWENFFEDKISDLRNLELSYLRKSAILGAITFVTWFASAVLVALVCFTTFVLVSEENILDAHTAFVSLAILNSITFLLTWLPQSIRFSVESYVSLKRINKFLLLEERDPTNVQYNTDDAEAIMIKDGCFSWGDEDRTVLSNISLKMMPGSLVAIVGSVGSGKSSLISAILGDMKKTQGSVRVNGSQAYVPQQAWIQNMTLKQNIIFDAETDEKRYQSVIESCALAPDLKILPGRDQTEIGEKGINLSGGQKQRISLARAVYQNADIYLLDDPLSAVDAHVGKHIFDKVIGHDGTLKGKTRVLVTHGISYLPKVDNIIVIKDGKITETGSYQELLDRNGDFAEFLHTYIMEAASEDEDEEIEELKQKLKRGMSNVSYASIGKGSKASSARSSMRGKKSKEKTDVVPVEDRALAEGSKLTGQEVAEDANFSFDTLKAYIDAASRKSAVLVLASMALTVASQVGTNVWLSEWTTDPIINGTQDIPLRNMRLGVYGALALTQAFTSFGVALGVALGGVAAATLLHSQIVANILKCPMSFFDTTPLGRIVNRLSKDIDHIDVNIPQYMQMMITTLTPIISTFILISYVLPVFIAVFVPVTIIFCVVQRLYVRTARQLKRLDSIKRSPMYAFFSETISGYSSIRAYKQEKRFMDHNDDLIDISTRAWFPTFTSNRWIGVAAEALGDIVILSTALLIVARRDLLDPGLVGLSLSFALQISINLILTLRSSCDLETYIVAVERVIEYINEPTEAAWIIPDRRPAADWPVKGEVTFDKYSTRYRAGLDLVLRDVTCTIKHGEMVGVVGRTGAGKSSMTLALFRIIEPAAGTIKIDGLDVTSIGLHDVRNQITIIPQDPVLFSGSIRFNLDPSGRYSDKEIWHALEHAHLRPFVSELSGQLEFECGEDGANLSVGQRQLVCLARALLKKAKILVLDEATSAVDMETDELIQNTIRDAFKDYTVFTIAHRINTIMDYDRIMVLGQGKLLEFDAPEVLKEDRDSVFHSMAKEAGLVQ